MGDWDAWIGRTETRMDRLDAGMATRWLAMLDRDELQQGEEVLAQIHLDRPLMARRQDLFIIRSYSPMTTIGGGRVIDSEPLDVELPPCRPCPRSLRD